MNSSYTKSVATARFGYFFCLLFRWQNSIYKLIWKNLLAYLALYYVVYVICNFGPVDVRGINLRQTCRNFCFHARDYLSTTTLGFILGSYVTFSSHRRWQVIMNLPLIDSACLYMCAFLRDSSKRCSNLTARENKRLLPVSYRRMINRYLSLSSLLCFQTISLPVKLRFKDEVDMMDVGLMTAKELLIYKGRTTKYPNFVMPLVWSVKLLNDADQAGYLYTLRAKVNIHEKIDGIRENLLYLHLNDWINIPLVYYQVVTIGFYGYLFISIFARQLIVKTPIETSSTANATDALITENSYKVVQLGYAFPIFSLLEIAFYLGWYKVAEYLFQPFGMGDDCFDLMQLVGRNLTTGYLYVDDICTDEKYVPEIFHTIMNNKMKDMEDVLESGSHVNLRNKHTKSFRHPRESDYLNFGSVARLEDESMRSSRIFKRSTKNNTRVRHTSSLHISHLSRPESLTEKEEPSTADSSEKIV